MSMDNLELVFFAFGIPLMPVLIGLLIQVIGRYIYNYRIGPSGIVFLFLMFFPTTRIGFRNIAEIKVVSYRECSSWNRDMFFALRAGNRIFGKIVLIRKRKGFRRVVLITPDNAEEFVRIVREKLIQIEEPEILDEPSRFRV